MNACRSCKGGDLVEFLDLGRQPLANALVEDLNQVETRYPLGLEYCPSCTFVQLTHILPPEAMFLDYPYVTGTSSATRAHFDQMAHEVVEVTRMKPGATVVDIGGNDGTLAQAFHYRGMRALNVEPARNVAKLAQQTHPDVTTIPTFFNRVSAEAIAYGYGKVDLVTACNVFTHVPDPRQFLEDVKVLLADDGTLVLEIYYLWDLIRNGAFDQVYHEHMSYFSLTTLDRLVSDAGLRIWRAENIAVQGGSLRVYISWPYRRVWRRVMEKSLILVEGEPGREEAFRRCMDFRARAVDARRDIRHFLRDARDSGRRVVGYAAAAKATVLLNYCEIGPDLIPYVVDKNPMKQGKYLPGVHIPIFAPGVLEREPPDCLLIFSWNLAEEIVQEWAHLKDRGTRFIVPLPELEEVGWPLKQS